jgi:phosphoglycolate phosphatase-like HAD superfamily hydrolase
VKVYFGDTTFECDAIAFDKDGTLIDRYALWLGLYEARRALLLQHRQGEAILRVYVQMLGIDPSNRTVDLHGPLASASLYDEQLVLATAIYQATRMPWAQARRRAIEIVTGADGQLPVDAYATPLLGVPQVLLDLAAHGLPLAVLTTDYADRTRDTLCHLGLEEAIAYVVDPSDVAHGKPEPDMILHAARQLGVEPSRMAMVGDAPVDLEMARSAGAFPIALIEHEADWGLVNDLAEAVIRSIAEIGIAAE